MMVDPRRIVTLLLLYLLCMPASLAQITVGSKFRRRTWSN